VVENHMPTGLPYTMMKDILRSEDTCDGTFDRLGPLRTGVGE
jgi:hypothetical protein